MKTCSCGATYTKTEWVSLPLLGVQELLELRNCPKCRSTLATQISPSAALSRPEAGPKRVPPPRTGRPAMGAGTSCRIIVQKSTWACQTLGCKARGTVGPHQLVHEDGRWIKRKTAPGPHPFVPGETCLFDHPPPLEHVRDRKSPPLKRVRDKKPPPLQRVDRKPAIEHSLIRVEGSSRTWLSDWPTFSEAREEGKKLKDPKIEVVPSWKWHNGEA